MSRERRAVVTEGRAPRPWLLLCCVLLAVIASYLPVLGAPLIWDDQHLIEHNPLVSELHPLADYFSHGFWEGDELSAGRFYYRPLTILSLALDQHLYGGNPGGFHVSNLLFHLLASGLLYALLRARGSAGQGAVLGTALWALYPRLSEAVAWVSGRTDVLATCFVLAALLAQARPSSRNRLLCGFFLLLALFCKEVALAGVVAVLAAELLGVGSLRARALRIIPTLLACALYLLLRVHAVGLRAGLARDTTARLLPALATLGHYFVMLCTPWFPNLQIGRVDQPGPVYVVLGGFVLITLVGWMAYRFRLGTRVRPALVVPSALVLVGLALVLHLVPLSVSVLAADRFLYLPLAGLTLLLTPALAALDRAGVVLALGSLLGLSFAVATYRSSNVWSDEVGLWTKTYRENPGNDALACVELGRLYARAGLFPEAIALDRSCAERARGSLIRLTLQNNAASVLARSGHLAEAVRISSELAQRSSDVPVVQLNLALYLAQMGDFARARLSLARALASDPEHAAARAFARRLPELEASRARLDALPANAPALERAQLLAELGLVAQSLRAFRVALRAAPPSRASCERAFSLALAQGDAESVSVIHASCERALAETGEARWSVAYDAYRALGERLRAAWPSLNVHSAALSEAS